MSDKRLYIRADMNEVIATGHVMRCLSIADAGKKLGIKATFITADDKGRELIKSHGHDVIVMNTKWDDMEAELPTLAEIIKENNVRRILVDSYKVTPNYFDELSSITSVYYMDDLNAFHYNVDGIICYANYYEKFEYEKNYPNTKLLLGPKYVPLREEFSNLPPKIIRDNIEKVLILSGGTDNYHACKLILSQLEIEKYKSVDVICGRYNADYEELCDKYSQFSQVHILKNVNNLVDYMLNADVAISAGGSTLYELCACGTPTITYSFADNQLDNVKKFDEDGLMRYVGDLRRDFKSACFRNALEGYKAKDVRGEVIARQYSFIKGEGTFNIIRTLFE